MEWESRQFLWLALTGVWAPWGRVCTLEAVVALHNYPWYHWDFCLHSSPTPLSFLAAAHLFLPQCCSSLLGLCCKTNCWKVQQSGFKISGKGGREEEQLVLLSVQKCPISSARLSPTLPPALRSHLSEWELKQLKLSGCVLTSAAALVFLLKLHF